MIKEKQNEIDCDVRKGICRHIEINVLNIKMNFLSKGLEEKLVSGDNNLLNFCRLKIIGAKCNKTKGLSTSDCGSFLFEALLFNCLK